MKITQARISNSIATFKSSYLSKFNLLDCYNIYKPVVFFGMYDDSDYSALRRFNNKIVVVWCGTDALMITSERAKILKQVPATHIVKSEFMSDDLKKFGIPHKILPVSWQQYDIKPLPLGDCIFHYGQSDFYGHKHLNKIEKATGLKIYRTTKDTYTKDQLLEVYRKCFIGLRLTKHDGLPNTVLEMGMMGRKSIYNGGIPSSIRWRNIDDVISSITNINKNRSHENIHEVSWKIKNFINIGTEWLEYEDRTDIK